MRRVAAVVPPAEARRSSRAAHAFGNSDVGGRPEDPAITLPSGESDASDETGRRPWSKHAVGEHTKFKFTAPPSVRPKAPPTAGPWRSAAESARRSRGVKRTVGGRALSVPAGRQSGETVTVATSSTRHPVAAEVARAGRRPQHSDGESGPGRKRSRTVPRGASRTGGGEPPG